MNLVATDKKFRKATKFESEQRVTQVIEWQLSGKTSSEIVQLAASKWGICQRQSREYIHKANKAVLESMEQTEPRILAQKFHQPDGYRLSLYRISPHSRCNPLSVSPVSAT